DGHMSLVIVPGETQTAQPQPSDALRAAIAQWLDARRLLGTRVHIVGPRYVSVTITATLTLRSDYAPAKLREEQPFLRDSDIIAVVGDQARMALQRHFHLFTGGLDQQGWPFGRAVYRSEVYQLLDQLEAVDYVDAVVMAADESRMLRA